MSDYHYIVSLNADLGETPTLASFCGLAPHSSADTVADDKCFGRRGAGGGEGQCRGMQFR